MSYLEIILPFSIPPASMAKAMQTQVRAPALASLFSTAKAETQQQFDAYARALPHEAYLYQDQQSAALENSPPLAAHYLKQYGHQISEGFWFCLDPVHIHVARDHLVMTDPRRLAIPLEEAQLLFQEAQTICAEYGRQLVWGDAKHWFLRADDWRELKTASLDAACGHNMDIWLASGSHERAWRRLQNEIQMAWHILPLHEMREARGERAINSVWLHSGSDHKTKFNFSETRLNFRDWRASNPSQQRVILPHLLEAALNSDWGDWIQQLNDLEQTWFAPLKLALMEKQLTQVKFVLSHDQCLSSLICRAPRAWQFWRKPHLRPLFNLTPS